MTEVDKLRALGNKCLSEQGQRELEVRLQDGDLDLVRIYLLGAVDGLWQRKEITDEEAREYYGQMGLSPEKTAEIRSSNIDLWK